MSLPIRKGDFVQATEANRAVPIGTPGKVVAIQTNAYRVEWQPTRGPLKTETHSHDDIEPLTSD